MKKPQIINLPKAGDRRGSLSVIEQIKHTPFDIKRVFWIYDVPGDAKRGGHAFRRTEEFIVALSGSFDVVLNDGEKEYIFSLNRSYYGVYIPRMYWREMRNFSTNSVALVVASTSYREDDYILDFKSFIDEIGHKNDSDSIPTQIRISKFEIKEPTVFDCSEISLPKHLFDEGNLTCIEQYINVPFSINRVFYLYDIPGGEERGAHAHKKCHQFLVAASGAFEVVLDDGINKRTILLNRPYMGLHIPPGIWASEQSFSSGSVCLVLASEEYNESDYIRDYNEFISFRKI